MTHSLLSLLQKFWQRQLLGSCQSLTVAFSTNIFIVSGTPSNPEDCNLYVDIYGHVHHIFPQLSSFPGCLQAWMVSKARNHIVWNTLILFFNLIVRVKSCMHILNLFFFSHRQMFCLFWGGDTTERSNKTFGTERPFLFVANPLTRFRMQGTVKRR